MQASRLGCFLVDKDAVQKSEATLASGEESQGPDSEWGASKCGPQARPARPGGEIDSEGSPAVQGTTVAGTSRYSNSQDYCYHPGVG